MPGATLWTRTSEGGDFRILPDGCMDLLLSDDELIVAGPDSRAWIGTAEPGTEFAGIRFAPGMAPRFLGVPARELLNQRVSLGDLWSPSRSRRLADQVRSADVPALALEQMVADLTEEPADRLITQVLRAVRDGVLRGGSRMLRGSPRANETRDGVGLRAGRTPTVSGTPARRPDGGAAMLEDGAGVLSLASSVGLSERQLHRRCLDAFGYGPKMLDRVLHLNVALDHARTGLALAEVAARFGYADQAHFTRDVKALTGLPPRLLLS
ncbi:helix-turn-helix protein [Kribbella antiqua]|uniref:Helix-turn-helix protein n=1 Tax=Kribbella antiqua TaxID=2512217 RepID=A0A4R2IS28_9ACTN|nr:helix-turn-helix protein [Kribbella antiqua]